MLLSDAIKLVLAEYPDMKAIGAAENTDAWIVGLISPLRQATVLRPEPRPLP